jgi:hypothetical protein
VQRRLEAAGLGDYKVSSYLTHECRFRPSGVHIAQVCCRDLSLGTTGAAQQLVLSPLQVVEWLGKRGIATVDCLDHGPSDIPGQLILEPTRYPPPCHKCKQVCSGHVVVCLSSAADLLEMNLRVRMTRHPEQRVHPSVTTVVTTLSDVLHCRRFVDPHQGGSTDDVAVYQCCTMPCTCKLCRQQVGLRAGKRRLSYGL